MLIGARLNWLLSHGRGKTWGSKAAKQRGGQKFIQIDISPQEADSNVPTDAPVVGDIGSCVAAMLAAIDSNWPAPSADWLGAIAERRNKNIAKMTETLAKNPTPMSFQSALNVVRDIVKANPDAMLVNEGANALDFTRSIVDMYKPRKRLDVGTWGVMGIGMGYSIAAAVVSGEQVIAIEGDSAFGFSGMEVETICRYDLPVCVVILNNNGVYRGDEVNPTGGPDPSPLVFVKDARYEKLMEAFGGVGVHATTPGELRRAMEEAIRSRKPTLINAVIDEKGGTESGPDHEPQSERQRQVAEPAAGPPGGVDPLTTRGISHTLCGIAICPDRNGRRSRRSWQGRTRAFARVRGGPVGGTLGSGGSPKATIPRWRGRRPREDAAARRAR